MRIVLVISTLLCFYVATYANPDSIQKVHFTIENGLPTNNVYSFLQDSHGYIWFATENGLVKFNGYSYKTFTTNDGLPSNDIWYLTEDSHGRIWITCYAQEFGYIKNDIYHKLQYKTSRITKPGPIREIGSKIIFAILDNGQNKIVIADTNDKCVVIKLPLKYITLYITSDIKFYTSNTKSLSIRETSFSYNKFISRFCCNQVLSMLNAHGFLITSAMKLNSTQTGTKELRIHDMIQCTTSFIKIEKLAGYKDDEIVNMEPNTDTTIIYTKNAAYTFLADFHHIETIHYNKYFANIPRIAFTLTDKTKNIWFATQNEGAYMAPKRFFAPKKPLFIKSNKALLYAGALSNGTVCWWDTDKFTLIGIDSNANICFSKRVESRVQSVVDYEGNSILLVLVNDIIQWDRYRNKEINFFKDKDVFISSDQLYRFTAVLQSPATNGRAKIREEFKKLESVKYRYIIKDKNNQYAVLSTNYAGKITLTKNSIDINQLNLERYKKLYYNNYANLYYYYNDQNILIADFDNNTTQTIGNWLLKLIGSTSIKTILSDRYGNVYIHTNNKLVVFNINTFQSSELHPNVNLANVEIALHNDYLTIIGPQGMLYTRIDSAKSDNTFKILPQINYGNYSTVYNYVVCNNGNALVNTDKGLYTFDLDSIIKQMDSYTSADAEFMKLNISQPYIKTISDSDTILLSKNDNSFKFDFINFYGKGERIYKYKINKLTSWIETPSGEVFLPNMKPERYYTVHCDVTDNLWKSKRYTFYLYKEPYWWQSAKYIRIFWITGVVLFIGFIFLIIFLTRYYVNKANEKKGRLLDLELRAVYSQINPHFIFNTLSSALFFINKRNFEEAYNHISKFSKLLRSYLSSSQERYVTLSDEISMLRNYIELQQIRFEEKFDFDITVENKIPAHSVKIPSLLLQPLVENAINHGLFHKQRKGSLHIKFEQGTSSDELICIIDDDGVGRNRAAAIKEQSTTTYTSYGTKLTKKLIDIFKEYENMNIFLEYIDKEAPLTGTIVKLTIRNLKYDA